MCEHIHREGEENRSFNTDVRCASKLLKNLHFYLDREHHDVPRINYKGRNFGTSSTTIFYYIWLNQVCILDSTIYNKR